MEHIIEASELQDPTPAVAGNEIEVSYQTMAESYGFKVARNLPYLVAGQIEGTEGWILHISVVKSQVVPLLELLLPLLKARNIPFKIPANSHLADSIIHGGSGLWLLGKVVCIYCQDKEILPVFAAELVRLTLEFRGPAIPTDAYLGGAVYARFGGFVPVLVSEVDGTVQEYIYNTKGKLVPDEQTVPFRLPNGVKWPFKHLAPVTPPKLPKILPGGYVRYSVLKPDMKGSVRKAISFRHFPRVDWCLIKEGNKFMCMEESGLDMRDRLLWQKELHEDLAGTAPVPKLLDYIIINDNHYLVLEFIEGVGGLDTFVQYLYGDNCWRSLPKSSKVDLVDFALQVIRAIAALHAKGYVHRDITLPNFLIDKTGKLYMIDLELAYSIPKAKPFPPFKLGTQGHMSPEQMEGIRPTLKEDMYALGASLLVMFTGVHPYKMRPGSPDALVKHLTNFIVDEGMAKPIAACLSEAPADRPTIEALLKEVSHFRERILSLPADTAAISMPYAPIGQSFCQQALDTLGRKRMASSKNYGFPKQYSTMPLLATNCCNVLSI